MNKLPSLKYLLNEGADIHTERISTPHYNDISVPVVKNLNMANTNFNLSLLSSVSLNYTYTKSVKLPSISNLINDIETQEFKEQYNSDQYLSSDSYSSDSYQSQSSSPKYTHLQLPPTPLPSPTPKSKRRQRLGPSCDCCRKRKVKCDATIFVLDNDFSELSESQSSSLIQGEQILIAGFIFLISFGKLIKFKPCTSCKSKNLDCIFSKGFTKDDLIKKNNVKMKKIVKRKEIGLRKSSCINCRKRKVKCVAGSNGCSGCEKKGVVCEFESKLLSDCNNLSDSC